MADYNVNKYSYNGNNYLLEDNRITLGSSTETFLRNDGTFTIPSVPEAYLTWGGKNFSANYAPIDAAMIDPLGANRFAFLKAAGLTIEYSRDGGSTWTDYGATDVQKVGLFANGYNFYLGKASAVADNNVNNQLRVTIDTGAASIYSVINKIAIYMSTNGNTVQVKLEKALQSTPTTYNTHLDWTGISGWGGWNILNITEITTYGNAAGSQYGRLRFTFRQTAINTSYGSANISRILGFGGMGWKTPSNMAKEGHLYSYDASQNATFPAKVTATQFNGLATKATADGDGNTIKTTYLKLAGGTMTGVLTALGSQYTDSYSGALNMNNSNIYGVNSIYTADASDNAQEGIHFYRSATTVDTIYANSGNLYFVPNRTLGTNGTAYTVYHTGNKPTYSDVGAAASSHNHNIENLTNFSARVYDATVSRTANTVLAAPNGSAGAATFRALVAADIPALAASKITSGTLDVARGGTAVTSADLIKATYGVEYIVGTQTAATNAWTGITKSAALFNGKTIAYKLPYAGTSTAATLNLTLSGGGTSGAKNVRINDSNVTTHFPANSVILLVYDGTYWRVDNYDSNTVAVRIYRQNTGYNGDYPLVVSRTGAGSIGTSGTDSSYTNVYGVMWDDTTKVPTLNPSTGAMKVPGGITANLTGIASKATAANITTTANAIAIYSNTTGTFSTKATASGAAYATSANGALTFGTLPAAQGGTGNTSLQATRNAMGLGNTTGALPVANGGTGATSLTSGYAIIGNGTSAVTTRAITNNTSATALAANTNIPTMNTVKYGLDHRLNRAEAVNAANTAYTTCMARGMSLHTADTNPGYNGAITWMYS